MVLSYQLYTTIIEKLKKSGIDISIISKNKCEDSLKRIDLEIMSDRLKKKYIIGLVPYTFTEKLGVVDNLALLWCILGIKHFRKVYVDNPDSMPLACINEYVCFDLFYDDMYYLKTLLNDIEIAEKEYDFYDLT